ncbi:SH3 domain-containing C40 family peptidase [Paenibacillus sp. YYML68]|uniref:C40 family peptidase n=1 Tax=Paenibacillus sp. YYML68 TaxID=2909250 RepID=UPI00248FD53A|nr:SH3 domain-containing C40 family peptidase [Paenibacillus sp. YYML68]
MRQTSAALLLSLFLMLTFMLPAALAEEAVPTKAKAISGVSFRDQPSTSSNMMRYLKSGEVVTVRTMVNPNWYHITDANGVTGFVTSSERFISIISNARTVSSVNFRTAPTTEASRIRTLQTGEEVLVLEKMNDSWYKAQDQNGVVGFLSSSSKFIIVNTSVTRIVLPLQERIESVISEINKYAGTPYEFGSERFDITTFDCSDLMQQSFWDATRVVLPGDSRGQGDYVKSMSPTTTDWKQLKRGDLMFFMSYAGASAADYASIHKPTQTITHVAIYLGDGNILHTFSPESGGVRTDSIVGRHWEYRFLFGGSAMK